MIYAPADIFTEHEPHRFVVDASDIGIRPGNWPMQIETNLGNGQPLVMDTFYRGNDGDTRWVRYNQQFGNLTVTVYND